MGSIFERLKKEFAVKQMKGCINVTLPIILLTSGDVLELNIVESENGYAIYCPNNMFLEANVGGEQEYYFNLFEKNDKNYHYDIKVKNGKFYKEYDLEKNVVVSIDEFVRFYIMLDNFIINNNVIGNESDFK